MLDSENKQILGTFPAADFVGRADEAEMLSSRAFGENKAGGLLLLSAPKLGASELLKQTFDRLFCEQSETIPVYFSLKKADGNARRAALRFAQTFLRQTIAFRRRAAKILDGAPDIYELAELAAREDQHWIDRTVTALQTENNPGDERAFIKTCLSAPLRAAAEGARVFLMFDDLHQTASLAGETDFVEELREIYARDSSTVSFVFSGHRRFLYNAMKTGGAGFETVELQPLSFADAGFLAEKLSEKYAVEINEQTRDLIGVEMQANPFFITSLFRAARAGKSDLNSFQTVQQIYTDEIFGNAIGKFYDAAFDEILPAVEAQKNVIALLYNALVGEREKAPVENWKTSAGLTDADFRRAVKLLNAREMVRVSSNLVEPMAENEILNDYIRARFRLESLGEARALVVGETLAEFMKRAPKTMARFYRQNSALDLRRLLAAFNCQETPAALLDYSIFTNDLKGATDEETSNYLAGDAEKISLPQIVYTARAAAFYALITQVIEEERALVGVGFDQCKYTDADETVWIAAEIDSKLEASARIAEFWCDRLEMVALASNFLRYKIWLVAPEGFAPDAIEILKARNAFGSSRRQINLLAKFLKAENAVGEKTNSDEYEIVVPMGDDTELIAAHAVEEIARRHSFKPKAINQIKTALVEACINATEHSLSPDRKIYQKFTVEDDKIIITISNRGLRLSDKQATEFVPVEGRRGWGLRLMKTLMDEVKFEQVDDGTRISMTKNK